MHTHRSAPQTAKVHKDLVSRVQAAENSTDRLQSQAQQLSTQINQLRNRALADSGLSDQINRGQLLAGQTAVTGPGIEVVLKDPPTPTATPSAQRGGTISINQTNTLTDRDVRSVVNELWADGAEAIAVNDIRLDADVGDPLRRRGGARRLPAGDVAVHDPRDRQRRRAVDRVRVE